MAKAEEILYAVVGAGDLAVEKIANVRKVADRVATEQVYNDFIKRGRTVSKRIRNSARTKQALAQTKTARSQVKAAATSVGKAVRANVDATRSAAGKLAKAS
ncbi:MAG: hypothetical protein M3238_05910 [Actinomycetota bacterium]|nr:hypothetical protein [Actinomycetota bacterium]